MNNKRVTSAFLFFIFLTMAFLTDNLRRLSSEMITRIEDSLIEETRLRAVILAGNLAGGLEINQEERSFFSSIEFTAPYPPGTEIGQTQEERLIMARQPIDETSSLLATRIMSSPLLHTIENMRGLSTGFVVLFLILCAATLLHLLLLFRKGSSVDDHEEIDPLKNYLAELQINARDLSEQVTAQSELASKSGELNRAIIANLPFPLLLINPAGRIEIFNPAAEKAFSCSYAAAKNSQAADILKGFPEITAIIKGSGTIRNLEVESAGQNFLIDLSVINGSGELLMIRDITAEKKREALNQLQSNFALLGEVAASFSHEIKNGLGAIYGLVSGHGSEEERENKVKREVDYLNAVIEGFLGFARPLSKLKSESCRLDEIVSHIAAEQKMKLELHGSDFLLPDSDPVLLNVIFSNLLVNSRQAGATQIQLRVKKSQHETMIEFSDNGPGIPATLKNKIWQPFFSGREGGSGLGLANVRKTVNFLGGQINLDNENTNGAVFHLTFPTKAVKEY